MFTQQRNCCIGAVADPAGFPERHRFLSSPALSGAPAAPVFADTGCGLSVSSSPSWWPCSWSLAVVLICIPSHLMTLSTFSCYCLAVCCSLPVSKLVSASCQGLGILEMFRGYVFSWVTNASSHSLTFLSTLMMTLSGRHIADAVF